MVLKVVVELVHMRDDTKDCIYSKQTLQVYVPEFPSLAWEVIIGWKTFKKLPSEDI